MPLPERAAQALDSYLRDVRPELLRSPGEQALFLTVQSWHRRRLGGSAIVHLLRGHARAAGIARVHPHALRHTCSTHLLRGGADIRQVQACRRGFWRSR